MWVDKYRPQKFTDLLGEEVSLFAFRSVAGIRLATY
jgi:DNA polymerase III gamma/tau subunit